MSNMTQRYAGALRRYAAELDKAGATPIKAEVIRQAAACFGPAGLASTPRRRTTGATEPPSARRTGAGS